MKRISIILLLAMNASIALQAQNMFERGAYKHDNHISWTMINAGYPVSLSTGSTGRFGGMAGFGYYLSLGFDMGSETTFFHYQGGLKAFPYKNFFVSAGYGTLGCEKMTATNDSNGRFNTGGYRQGKGTVYMFGYDIVGDVCLLSISAGMGFDISNESSLYLISLKFGFKWDIFKSL